MVGKLTGLAGTLALVLALVAGFVALPVDVKMVLLVLGIIAGIGSASDTFIQRGVAVLVLPAIGAAAAMIPAIGTQLSAVLGNVAAVITAGLLTTVAVGLFNALKDQLSSLGK